MQYQQIANLADESFRSRDLDELVVDHAADPGRCKAAIASLMDEYVAYAKHEHDLCRGCPVVRSGAVIVRSMLEWKARHRDGRLGRWTREDVRTYLLEHLARDLSPEHGLLLDAPTCAKDLVYFMADRGTLTGEDMGVLADATDEVLDEISDGDDERYVWATASLAQIAEALSATASPSRAANTGTSRRAKRKAARGARKRNRRRA